VKLKGRVVKNKINVKEKPHHFINGDGFYIHFEHGKVKGFKEMDDVVITIEKQGAGR